jgi:N-acetylglucosaminyldiphosphoundecaprenol N-acetyl-beta-D-mannosaminyltransferase
LKEIFERISILGVRVDLISLDELLQYISFIINSQQKAIITYINVHAVNIAYGLGWFKNFINHSQIVFCDGFGVKWAARILTGKILQRLTPPDWFDRLVGKCAEDGISIFLLGTRQEVVEKFAVVLKGKYPRLIIAGVQHGFFDKKATSSDNQEVLAKINALQPDILIVGFGMPAQEKWIAENWENLQVKIVIPVGAMFDYLAGVVNRAPRWMTDNGLEWLGRLWIEPGRLWKRYVIGIPLFLWRIFIHHILGFSLPN